MGHHDHVRVRNRIPWWAYLSFPYWFRGQLGRFLTSMMLIVRKRRQAVSIVRSMGHRIFQCARADLQAGRDFWYAIDKAAGRC